MLVRNNSGKGDVESRGHFRQVEMAGRFFRDRSLAV